MHKQPLDVEAATKTYRLLVTSMPPANQYLLLYILDLLAVFARKSELNRMPASSEWPSIGTGAFPAHCSCADLAVIFQPGIFSHPSHLQDANEHKIAVEVLEFLIEHQDHFVIGLTPPPPTNVDASELTSVSIANQMQGVPDVAELSDSDEELGVLTMHEGGGAKLNRRSTTAGGDGSSGAKKKLFRRRRGGAGTPAGATTEPATETSSLDETDDIKPSTPKGEIRELGLGQSPMVKVAGGLRRSRTVPSRRAEKEDKGDQRSVSSGKPRSKGSQTDKTAVGASDPTAAAVVHPDPGLPTPPPSKLLAAEEHKG